MAPLKSTVLPFTLPNEVPFGVNVLKIRVTLPLPKVILEALLATVRLKKLLVPLMVCAPVPLKLTIPDAELNVPLLVKSPFTFNVRLLPALNVLPALISTSLLTVMLSNIVLVPDPPVTRPP